MAYTDFHALHHQVLDQWQAIGQADPAAGRVLMVELAKVLAEWEAAQDEPLAKVQDLTRTGHWHSLAQAAAAEARRQVERLGEEKPALRQRLTDVATLIGNTQGEIQALTPAVEALRQELALTEATLADLEEREAGLRRQLATCRQLGELEAEIAAVRDELGLLAETLQRGDDPAEVLTRLASLREVVVGYYTAYLQASRDIAGQLAGGDVADAPPAEPASSTGPAPSALHAASAASIASIASSTAASPAPGIFEIPNRLLALDRELKAIDQVLADQLRLQDAVDRETKARV